MAGQAFERSKYAAEEGLSLGVRVSFSLLRLAWQLGIGLSARETVATGSLGRLSFSLTRSLTHSLTREANKERTN